MRCGTELASGRAYCRGNCSGSSEFINDKGRIKKGTRCAWVSLHGAGGSVVAYYCGDCMPKLYLKIRTELDPKLWGIK